MCRGSSGRCCRASSDPTSRSAATIRSSEYLADIAGTGVVKSVYVQANWAPEQAEDEVAWVQRTADETGWPHAIVGYADLLAEDVRPTLDRLKRYPLMRGIRMQLHWHENPQYRFASAARPRDDPTLRRNIAALADYGLSFDLQVFAPPDGRRGRLAADIPGDDLHPAARRHARRSVGGGPDRLARAACGSWPRSRTWSSKLSGLGTFIHRNDPEHIAWIVDETVALFGAGRCLFGSNFPIEKLWTDYATRSSARTARRSAGYSEAEQRAVLHDTARASTGSVSPQRLPLHARGARRLARSPLSFCRVGLQEGPASPNFELRAHGFRGVAERLQLAVLEVDPRLTRATR